MLKSLVPKLMEIKGWSITKLMREADISWGRAWDLAHGEIPGAKMLNAMCKTFKGQPSDIILYKEKG